jgi:hypothetical protein
MAIKSFKRSTIKNIRSYRSFLAGNSAYNPTEFELISTQVLASNQSSVTFSSLSAYAADYKHLQIRYSARGTNSYTTSFQVQVRFNGVSTSSYAHHGLNNGGVTTLVSTGTSPSTAISGGYYAGSGVTANTFGAGVMDILDAFSTNKTKVLRAFSGQPNNTLGFTSGFWNDTTAISSIVLSEGSGGGFITASRFSLYGIRG